MLGTRYGRFTALSEGGPSLSCCGTLCSAAQCCIASHSATAWVPKSGIADVGMTLDAPYHRHQTTYSQRNQLCQSLILHPGSSTYSRLLSESESGMFCEARHVLIIITVIMRSSWYTGMSNIGVMQGKTSSLSLVIRFVVLGSH